MTLEWSDHYSLTIGRSWRIQTAHGWNDLPVAIVQAQWLKSLKTANDPNSHGKRQIVRFTLMCDNNLILPDRSIQRPLEQSSHCATIYLNSSGGKSGIHANGCY